MSKILSFGEILWDIFPDYKKPGGSPANVAYHLKALGNQTQLISKVGNDKLGHELLQFIEEKGLNHAHIQIDQSLPTGTVTVNFSDGEPSYIIHQPAAWDEITFNTSIEKLSKQFDAICFASLSQRNKTSAKTLQKIISATKPQCLKVFDLNLRQPFYSKEIILKNIEVANLIKFNEDELHVVSDWLNVSNLPSHLLEKDSKKIILITLGSRGSKMITSDREYSSAAFPISDSGDFVGVGDAFLACVTHLLLKEDDPETILPKANKYAAFVASQRGGMPDIEPNII